MTYRTKRPRTRAILTFGVGATLAITQLGAGCVPVDSAVRCTEPEASTDGGGDCISTPGDAGRDGGGDAK